MQDVNSIQQTSEVINPQYSPSHNFNACSISNVSNTALKLHFQKTGILENTRMKKNTSHPQNVITNCEDMSIHKHTWVI